jgi:glucosylceramidase
MATSFSGGENLIVIKITRNVTYQKIIGFGGAMTDAAGINIASVSNKTGDNIIKAYYSDEGNQDFWYITKHL